MTCWYSGSPWSVYDPRIAGCRPELDLIRGHMDRGAPMLSICFGAQALSAAMGGRVTMSTLPEYGWAVEPVLMSFSSVRGSSSTTTSSPCPSESNQPRTSQAPGLHA
jgi:GMP synthase-like glutamine amidotransferase